MRPLIALVLLAAMAVHPAASAADLCTVIADARSGRIVLQQGDCGRRVTPASTFKIPLSLMGYDSGYLLDEHRPSLPFVEGYADWIDAWKTAVDPTYWMTYSVVWYSQQISPLEQIAFLRKVVNRRLSLAARAYDMTQRITQVDELPGGWQVHGKTGTASVRLADGTKDSDHAYGWFVGWVSKADRSYVFARLAVMEPPQADRAGPQVRDGLLSELPALLELPNEKP